MTFIEVCAECLANDEFVKHWNRLTGHRLIEPRSPIVMAIDQACGYKPDEGAMSDFIDFVFEFIWLPVIQKAMEETVC